MSLASSFDISNGLVLLRLTCGLFFIPHFIGKFTSPASIDFFTAAKFEPPAFWMYVAGTVEAALTLGLVLDVYTSYVALMAALHLFVATIAMYKLNHKWLWVIGGVEFCVFWILCCISLAFMTSTVR
ncbi:DoxX family protein [Bradyrhizobium mercantei]|uniref:DoxX family protein n=1 Tax=Bradyrhizobium mercantei TaxID=1904807 RepID=UPI0009780A9E|nr:DoxX family protein [Bradyrhizobium mercantei]